MGFIVAILSRIVKLFEVCVEANSGFTIYLVVVGVIGGLVYISSPLTNEFWTCYIMLVCLWVYVASQGRAKLIIFDNALQTVGKYIGLNIKNIPSRNTTPVKNYQTPVSNVASWPGITYVNNIRNITNSDDTKKREILKVEEILRKKIRFQDQAIIAVIRGLKRVVIHTEARTKSPASFILTGPTGTGKTEIVKLVAETLGKPFDRYDMGAYKSKEGVWQLLGSPQGYRGGEGKLTGFVKHNPNAILLFDEIEKAEREMFDFLLAILDEGAIKDNKTSEIISFKECMVFFTTNLITEISEDKREDPEAVREQMLEKGFLRPEMIGRIKCVVPFIGFSENQIKEIIRFKLEEYLANICEKRGGKAKLICEEGVIATIQQKTKGSFGVRGVLATIENEVGNKLTDLLFNQDNKLIRQIYLRILNGSIDVKIE